MCFALKDIGGEMEIVSTKGECPSERTRGVSITPSAVTRDVSERVHIAIPEGTQSNFPGSFFASGWSGDRRVN